MITFSTVLSKKQRTIASLLFAVVLTCSSLFSAPFKGFYGSYQNYKEEKKHLSPYNGFLAYETGYLEKMYRFGMIDVAQKKRLGGGFHEIVLSGDATIKLLHELFHMVGDAFLPTTQDDKIAQFLTPDVIGKLFMLFEKYKENNFATNNLCEEIKKVIGQEIDQEHLPPHELELAKKLIPQVKSFVQGLPPRYKDFLEKKEYKNELLNAPTLTMAISWIRKHLSEIKRGTLAAMLQGATDQSRAAYEEIRVLFPSHASEFGPSLPEESHDIKTIFDKTTSSSTKKLLEELSSFSKLLCDVLQECHFTASLKEQRYPSDTLHRIFLGFLYAKSSYNNNLHQNTSLETYQKQLDCSYLNDKTQNSAVTHADYAQFSRDWSAIIQEKSNTLKTLRNNLMDCQNYGILLWKEKNNNLLPDEENELHKKKDIEKQAQLKVDQYQEEIASFLNEHFETISFVPLFSKKEKLSLIPFTEGWGIVTLTDSKEIASSDNKRFANCNEVVFFSLLTALLVKIKAVNSSDTTIDATKIVPCLKEYAQEKKLSFNPATKELTNLVNFFEKYPAFADSRESSTIQAWHNDVTKLFSDLPGVYYLRAEEHSQQDITKRYTKSSHIKPFYHQDNTVDSNNSIDNHLAKLSLNKEILPASILRDDQFYLTEIAGYPGNFVALVKNLMGLSFDSFEELCQAFDITGKNLALFNDHEIAQENKKVRQELCISLDHNQRQTFDLELSPGHTSLKNLLKSSLGIQAEVDFLVTNSTRYTKNNIQENLQMLCTRENSSWLFSHDNKKTILFQTMYRFFCLPLQETTLMLSKIKSAPELALTTAHPEIKKIIINIIKNLFKETDREKQRLYWSEIIQQNFLDSEEIQKFIKAAEQKELFKRIAFAFIIQRLQNLRGSIAFAKLSQSSIDREFFEQAINYAQDDIINNNGGRQERFLWSLMEIEVQEEAKKKYILSYGLIDLLINVLATQINFEDFSFYFKHNGWEKLIEEHKLLSRVQH